VLIACFKFRKLIILIRNTPSLCEIDGKEYQIFYLYIWSQFCRPLTLCPLTNSPNQNLYQDAVSHSDRCDITLLLPEMLLPSSRSPVLAPCLQKSCPVHITRPYLIIIFLDFFYLLYGIKYLFYFFLLNLAFCNTDTVVA
jgi:hypothetical protein